jgi:hypothetical protein
MSSLAFAKNEEFSPQQAVAKMRAKFMSVLMTQLGKGAEHAVVACHSMAPDIPKEFAKNNVQAGRTSLKLRSLANAPRPWLKSQLDKYAASSMTKPLPGSVIDLDNGRKGYVEPIYVGAPCLACHGEKIEAKVDAKIKSLYPKDLARNYKEGEFRGLFWVEWLP